MEYPTEKTILLADDCELFRIKLSEILNKAGYKVIFAEDGREIIENLTSHVYGIDLLILDLQIPRIDGFGILKWIRENNLEGILPVLAITGAYEPTEVLTNLKELGASGLITKASSAEHLVYRVNRLIFNSKINPRVAIRVPTTIPVDISFGSTTSTAFILNLSETGAFIYYSRELPEIGDTIGLRFSMDGVGEALEADAKTVWINKEKDFNNNLFKGFGIRFENVDNKVRSHISTFVRSEVEKLDLKLTEMNHDLAPEN